MFPDRPAYSFAPGDTINDFKVISVIGRGGFGEVYQVQDVAGACFALKLLLRAEDKEFAGNFQVRSLNDISGFVAIHASGILPDGKKFFLMPLADNLNPDSKEVYTPDTLANRLAKYGKLPATELLDITIEIASACAELHKHKLVHGDIKPENIIFVRKKALLSDFSLLRPMAPPNAAGISGTLHFVPQEEVSGQLNGVSAQLDLYAIGMLLYTSFNLRPAIDYPAPGDGIDFAEYRVFRKIYNKALHKNPAFRYRDAESFIRDLKQAKAKIESGKTPWFQRKKLIYPICGVLLVSIVVILLWIAQTLHDQRFLQPYSSVKIDLDTMTIDDFAEHFAKVDKKFIDLATLKNICEKRHLLAKNDYAYRFLCKKIDVLLYHKQLHDRLKSSSSKYESRQIKRQILTVDIPNTPVDVMTTWRLLITPENFLSKEEFNLYKKTTTSTTDPQTHLKTYGASELNRAKIEIEKLTHTSEFNEFQKAIDEFRRLTQ